ncbi:MAG: hypothetical protein O2815_00690 [Actinomycetota bacterium]|nr:hypothetical protein [Actinomycetota bacterium]
MEERPIELIGVYHADGGIIGELRYVIGKATPTVLARWANGNVTALLGPEDLELEGSVSDFFVRLTKALASSS